LFVRVSRHSDQQPLPLSAVAVHRMVGRSCLAAGVPERLAHPHAFRAYWATHLVEAGVPVHGVSARLGHVDLRATAPRRSAPDPSASIMSPRFSIAATRPPGGRVGGRRRPARHRADQDSVTPGAVSAA
jgi:hypothetical protein